MKTPIRVTRITMHVSTVPSQALPLFLYLVDHELCDPLSEPAAGAVENHLQHVTIHLLHNDIDLHVHVHVHNIIL